MRMGLTVAQVYQQVAAKLTTDTTATTLKANGTNYNCTIVDKTETPDLDSLFNMGFETTTTDEDGSSVTETHTLGEFATQHHQRRLCSIARENGSRKMSVTSRDRGLLTPPCSPARWSRSWPRWICPTA